MRYSSQLSQLAALWLAEANQPQLDNARHLLGFDAAGVKRDELATVYADLFLLNVYPYASVFCEPLAEMNGARAQRLECLYREFEFAPDALARVGAADHLGLMMNFLEKIGDQAALPLLLDWAPVLCLAVEREPAAHPFYRALARETRARLFVHARAAGFMAPPRDESVPLAEQETTLSSVVQFFLAPARCGVFFSRAQLGQIARRLGQRLPFGSRYDVAHALFMSTRAQAEIEALLSALDSEIRAWGSMYQAWTRECPAWQSFAVLWLERIRRAQVMTVELRKVLVTPMNLEYASL